MYEQAPILLTKVFLTVIQLLWLKENVCQAILNFSHLVDLFSIYNLKVYFNFSFYKTWLTMISG